MHTRTLTRTLARTLAIILSTTFLCTGCGLIDAVQDAQQQLHNAVRKVGHLNAASLRRYAGLGSFWTYSRDDEGQFEISMQEELDSPVLGTVQGTWEAQESGFVRLAVTDGTGRFANPPTGIVTYGLEIPGTLFVLKVPAEDKLIYMPALDSCPTGSLETSGIVVSGEPELIWDSGELTHGLISIDMEAGSGLVDARVFGSEATVAGAHDQHFQFSCEDNILHVEQGKHHDSGVLTQSGVGSVDNVLLVPTDETITLADLAGSYAGISLDNPDTVGNRQANAFKLTLAAGGTTGTADTLSAVDNSGTLSGVPFSIAITTSEGAIPGGFLYSLVGDTGETDHGLGVMLAVRNLGGSGKTFLAGYGQGRRSRAPYFMFAISK